MTVEEFEQTLTDVPEDLIRHTCDKLGVYRGPSVVLYDEHGQGIRDRERLERILDGGRERWIVPADVHY